MSNEIVKYENQLNEVPLRRFTPTEMDLFFSIISRMRDKGDKQVTFSFEYLQELSQYKVHKQSFYTVLKNTYTKLLELNVWQEDEKSYQAWVLFTEFEINKRKRTVKISVNPKLKNILNALTNGFTRFSLPQFVEYRSSYSKSLFRLLKQYRVIGKMTISLDRFRLLLDIPKSYSVSNIDKTVLNVSLAELKYEFENLKCEKIKQGRNHKIVGYTFTFTPQPKNASDFGKHAVPSKSDQFKSALLKEMRENIKQ